MTSPKLDLSIEAKLITAKHTVKDLLKRINEIENDNEMSTPEKLEKIKKIQEEITKVGTEIDNIKREIRLLNAYNVN